MRSTLVILAALIFTGAASAPADSLSHGTSLPSVVDVAAPNTEPRTMKRIAGEDRFETAAEAAKDWGPGVAVAYVANGRSYPDALTAASIAGLEEAPVLLTDSHALPEVTESALRRLRPNRIVILGGTSAVSEGVKGQLGGRAGSRGVERIAGPSRYATAAMAAALYETGPRRVYLASGENFPDALAAASVANKEKVPLLLTRRDQLDKGTVAQLKRLSAREIVVVGGERAISAATAGQAASLSYGSTSRRIAGPDRYATAALVAQSLPSNADQAIVASGRDFPDALVGAALAGRLDAPVILTDATQLPSSSARELRRTKPRALSILGGPSAIRPRTVVAMVKAIGGNNDAGYASGWGLPEWRDEFAGSNIDESKWRIRDHSVDGNAHYDWAVIQREAVSVRSGLLRIRAKELKVPVQGDGRTRYWSTGYLDTRDRFTAPYGRWEIRAKLPTTRGNSRGVWPAFWLRNASLGEIDIMESWGDPTKRERATNMIETSVFTAHESTRGDLRRAGWYYEHQTAPGQARYWTAGEMHTWTLEYTPTNLRAYLDGRLAVDLTPKIEKVSGARGDYSWVWGKTFTASPWEMRLNLQMGDPWYTPGPEPSSLTEVPVDFDVDYVRYWADPA